MTKQELLAKLETAAQPGSDIEEFEAWLLNALVAHCDPVGLVAQDVWDDIRRWAGPKGPATQAMVREHLHEYAHRLRNTEER